ncbi:kinase-like domain-containing protein [Rhizophagus irregularis DAOM 181602=DAOM 197198]|nr:kinase-like domain-containing protein [Rhizophagus irregularis DAOM 181602=DAOM 197198]
MLEWIEYDRFENVEYLAKGGFGTIYKAIWKDGCIYEWDSINDQWERIESLEGHKNFPVVLKCLHNSQDMTSEFLREIESHTMIVSSRVTRCYGITKDPESNNFMMNAIDNKDDNNSFGEYSESIEAIDFTKLNLEENN